MSKSVSIRLSDNIANKLDEVTKKTERSRSFLIQKALEAYLDEMSDLQIALDRIHDPTDSIITFDEMRNKLDR